MAKIVGYFENFETNKQREQAFSEGPFVAVNAEGWRIEVECKNNFCPILPDLSIYRLLENELGKAPGKLGYFEDIAPIVDALNTLVTSGEIVLQNAIWVCPRYQ